MKYRKGYKYQIAEDDYVKTDIIPERRIVTQFITLDTDGMLGIKSGYASDGCSGPMLDTKPALRG